MAVERKRLGRLKLEGNADLDVAASLALSVRELRWARPDLADSWHELAVFPERFDAAAAGGIWNLSEEAANEALGLLLARSMVLYDTAQRRWRLHDLMRDLAGGWAAVHVLGAPADLAVRLTAGRRRHAEHYRSVLAAADDLYLQGGTQVLSGLALFDLERRNIEAGQTWAAEAAIEDPVAAHLCLSYPDVGAYVLSLRQHPLPGIGWRERAVVAARKIGDRRSEGHALGNLGLAYAALGETSRAVDHFQQVLAIMREIGDRRAEGSTLDNLGNAYMALGQTRRAVELLKQHVIIAREVGDRRGESNSLGNLGLAYAGLGETRRAIELYDRRLVIAREIGDRHGEGNSLDGVTGLT